VDQSAVSARLIGLMFVEKGLITEEQLELALEKQRETGDRLGEIIVNEFGVERLDLAGALAEQWAEYESAGSAEEREQHAETRDLVAVSDEWRGAEPTPPTSGKRPIGEIFVERGLISAAQLEDALEEQKKSGRRLGEILVATGRLTRLELASALADQWASFQKLRPPGEEAPTEARVLPMPVTSLPPTPAPPSPELTRRLDELASRVEELASRDGSAEPTGDDVAQALIARVDQLESSFATREPAAPMDLDELRSQLSDVTARIESLPATRETDSSIEWRSELAEVAGNLRTRIERIEQGLEGRPSAGDVAELRAAVEALVARVDSLPAPSEEWRGQLAQLAAQLETLSADDWRPNLEKVAEKLRSRLERLEQSADNSHPASDVAELRARVDELVARFESLPTPPEEWREPVAELAARFESLPLGEWRPELAEVAENLRTRIERVEQSAGSDRASADVADLRAALDELRSQLAGTASALESISGQSGEWRVELAEVAGNLRARLERVEQSAGDGGAAQELAELRGSLEVLAARVDALPAGSSEEWREPLAELAQNLHARLERVELSAATGQATAEVAELRARLEDLARRVDSLPAPSAEWREPIAELAARVDALPSGEWRPELSEIAMSLSARLERLEHEAESGRGAAEVAELRVSLEALAARADALPTASEDWREPLLELARRVDGLATPSDEWRSELAALAARIDSIRADEWRSELAALAARVDALPAPDDQQGHELSEVVRALGARVDQVEQESARVMREALDGLHARVDEVASGVGNVEGVEARLRESLTTLADERLEAATAATDEVHRRLDELAGGAERGAHRVEELAHRVEELAARPDGSELEQALARRVAALEDVFGGLRDEFGALPSSIEQRLAELDQRGAAAAGQAAADVASLRHELENLKGGVEAARTAASEQIDAATSALRDELEVAARNAAGSVGSDVRAAMDENAARVERLADDLALAAQHNAARSADLSALRARLETVETALSGTLGWHEAAESARTRVEELELRMSESFAAEAVERDDQIDSLRAEFSEHAGAFERERVKRKELRRLREAVEHVERRLEKRKGENAAAARATEAAVRKGIESLGRRLTDSGEAYLDTSRELSRSIAGLGMALAASDALHVAAPRATDAPNDARVFLAFAPTSEGYRLVECEGTAPNFGDELNVADCEGPLVVTRVGASPLPFDRRPCVYLEPAD